MQFSTIRRATTEDVIDRDNLSSANTALECESSLEDRSLKAEQCSLGGGLRPDRVVRYLTYLHTIRYFTLRSERNPTAPKSLVLRRDQVRYET